MSRTPANLSASSTLREAACGRRLWSLGIDDPCSHQCEACGGVAKREERVGWAMRRGEASAVGGVGAAVQELVGLQSLRVKE